MQAHTEQKKTCHDLIINIIISISVSYLVLTFVLLRKQLMGKKQGMEEQRSGVDVLPPQQQLPPMLVTAAVSHLERSALNTDAPTNAVEVLSMPWWSQSKIKVEEERRKKKWVRKQKSMKDTGNGRTKNCSGRTVIQGRHLRRVPLGKVRVECKCLMEHCRSIVNAVVVPIQK